MDITLIQFRRGTAAEWAAENPVLNDAEPGYETDTGRVKVGDGTQGWNALGYVGDPVAPMTLEDVLAEVPPEDPGTVSPLVLKEAIIAVAEAAGLANVYIMPIWDGAGEHPLRPAVPDTFVVIWRQPTAPLAGEAYAHDGDEWEVTEGAG